MKSAGKVLHAFSTGQERRSKPESSAAKLYCLHLQEQECKSKSSIAYIFRSQSARAQECKSLIAYIFRSKKQEPEQESKSARARAQEPEQECKKKNKNKKAREQERENGETPSPLRRIILRLGRVTP